MTYLTELVRRPRGLRCRCAKHDDHTDCGRVHACLADKYDRERGHNCYYVCDCKETRR